MQTQRILLVLTVLFIISCNSNKNKDWSLIDHVPLLKQADPDLSAVDAVNIHSYNAAYTESVTEKFTVINKRVTVITGKQGLKVTVDPSSLVKEDGSPVDGKINVSMIELTNSDDLFRANMTTTSDDRLLASGGSYFIGMECNGQKLKLQSGKTLEVVFPLLKKDEMELFYGERNTDEAINWKRASLPLQQQFESMEFTDSNRYETNMFPQNLLEMEPARVYKSLYEPVYYYKKRMTLHELVDTLNRKNAKVALQTISFWPKNLPTDRVLDTNYLTTLYGPRLQYILKTCKNMDEETAAVKRRNALRDSLVQNWKPRSLAGQLQKYYAPANLQALGWINCDRFVQPQPPADIYVDVPDNLNNSRIEYFIIYRSINGLTNSRIDFNEQTKMVLKDLPAGEKVTLIAFAKSKGIIYHCKEDFVIQKDKRITPNFEVISAEEMGKMFGKNVRS